MENMSSLPEGTFDAMSERTCGLNATAHSLAMQPVSGGGCLYTENFTRVRCILSFCHFLSLGDLVLYHFLSVYLGPISESVRESAKTE